MEIDLHQLADLIAQSWFGALSTVLRPVPGAIELWIFNTLRMLLMAPIGQNLLIHNPVEWITEDTDVLDLYQNMVLAQALTATFVLAIQGLRVMAHRVDVYEAVGRTVFFVMIGNTALFLVAPLLRFFNGMSDHIMNSPVDITNQQLPSSLELGFMLLIALALTLLTWVKGAVGIVFLKVLVVIAPYFLTLSALPLFEGLGQWWAEELTTWTLRPFMVALCMRLGLGLAAREEGAMGMLFMIVTFWLAWTMDTRIRRFSMGAWGSVGQLGLFARGAGMIAGAVGGPAGAAAGGAAAGAASAAASPALGVGAAAAGAHP